VSAAELAQIFDRASASESMRGFVLSNERKGLEDTKDTEMVFADAIPLKTLRSLSLCDLCVFNAEFDQG
jgi:hypothetical protein